MPQWVGQREESLVSHNYHLGSSFTQLTSSSHQECQGGSHSLVHQVSNESKASIPESISEFFDAQEYLLSSSSSENEVRHCVLPSSVCSHMLCSVNTLVLSLNCQKCIKSFTCSRSHVENGFVLLVWKNYKAEKSGSCIWEAGTMRLFALKMIF